MAGLLGRAREDEHERLLAEQQAGLAALAARIDAGESERGRLADRCAALEVQLGETRRELDEARSALFAANDRISRMEQQADGVLPLLTAALVRRLEAETSGGELPDVSTALGRIDRQLKAYMGDTDRTMRAVIERLEELHRARG